MEDKAFISYLDDDNTVKNGYFEIIDVNGWKVSFKIGDNIITLPYSRILKIKEKLKKEGENDR